MPPVAPFVLVRPNRDRCEAPLTAPESAAGGRRRIAGSRYRGRQGLTLIGVALGNLDDDGAVQLALPFDRRRAAALDAVLDDVRGRFGSDAITRAVLLGRDPGLSVPLLPD